MTSIHPVILCGGSGTRLWPRSRKAKPKPFLPLVGDRTLFEATLARCPPAEGFAYPVIVTGAVHVPHVETQIGEATDARIVVEPAPKNTAAAIALAAQRLPTDAVMLVCPSDHHIGNPKAFRQAAHAAARLARDGMMVAMAIEPTHPETGYGYIRHGEPIEGGGRRIAQFVEKPDLARATQFLAEGGYSWNGGIFAFRAGDFLEELATYRPALAEAVRRSVEEGCETGSAFHPDAGHFAKIEPESVDYAVMEETRRAAMVPAAMGWSDIGGWPALRDTLEGDERGNRTRGKVELRDCRNVLADTDGPRISIIGMDDIAVVVDGDEVLVTSMSGAQEVGKLEGAANQ
ncbi:mannose-1-phosphate guanylyltransferase [Aurantiacibacter spongiae]|uniref:Mannose-1-phosphate guanylyltransferase n=1 Tax=Aurantiacibacter spongiae TaxID=2488860 RepID=A0A3N5CPZ7_9SPHN|nr:sugar phosphate nucleotidyltransferase [Aurantiacibacter spongiae]RPF71084.1 mannose-1-phosphate guanylyltransferase [Aurantiacibacter spongiae]